MIRIFFVDRNPRVVDAIKTKLNNSITNIIYAPTMEKPQNISDTLNVQYAFTTILNESYSIAQNTYKSDFVVVCPGLGCLTGKMPFDKMAEQMIIAWELWQVDVFKSTKNETISNTNV